MAEYRPGACNIGHWNRLYRLAYACVFAFLSFLVVKTVDVNHFPQYSKALAFIPLFFMFLNIYEAALGFCVNHARKKTHEMR